MIQAIEDLTIREAKELARLFSVNPSEKSDNPFEIGKAYLIRTVTMALLGVITWVGEKELKIDKACWVADTGRFSNALRDGIEKQSSAEIEPFDAPIIVGRGSIIDAVEYKHKLPSEQK